MLSSLPCSYAFCWSAIPTSCYIFNVFLFLFMSLFPAADVCMSWSLPSITEQQVSPHRLPVQYWLKNHWLSSNTPHTNSISNSAILHNNYISLLSDLCACVHVKRKWRRKGSHSSSVSGSNRLVRLITYLVWRFWEICLYKHVLRVRAIPTYRVFRLYDVSFLHFYCTENISENKRMRIELLICVR